MAKGILGTKLGMTQLFDPDSGTVTPVTVIEAGPCPVVQVKTLDTDGYQAVQLAYRPVKERRLNRPEAGHFRAVGVAAHRHVAEIRGGEGAVGDSVTVAAFAPGERVKVTGRSKGKGFAGTVKRHRFGRGPVSHGSHNVRAPGSIGASATPSRVFPGQKMAGHLGDARATQRGLRVVEVDEERNLLLVRGAVPGATGGLVLVRGDG
jgi:large subunit ribosomal protein L3